MTSPRPELELEAPAADADDATELLWPPVPLEDLEGLEGLEAGAEGLYGAATVSPGVFAPTPVVSIGGTDLRADAAGVDAGLVVIDGVTITWGRDDVLDQPTPATGRLQVLDLTNTWATSADRRGQLVTLRWEGMTSGGLLSGVYFRGRVGTPVSITTRTVLHPTTGQPVTASVVDLPLQSILVDLANRIPTVDWPVETLGARATRVQSEAVAAGSLSSVVVRDYWKTPNVGPVVAADQVSVLDHLVALYDSSGADRFTYFPTEQRTENLVRRAFIGSGLAGLSWDPAGSGSARDGQGVYARSFIPSGATTGAAAAVAMYLDAAALEADPADGIYQPSLVTLVQVTHPDAAAATPYSSRTSPLAVTGANEALTGRRTASLESIVASAAYADVSRNDLEDIVRREGSAWRLPALRYSTRKLGGFERPAHAQVLLQGAETNTLVFLERSMLPALGLRPLVGIMGATITYAAGGWDLDLALAPVTSSTPQHAITWSEIDDGSAAYEVQWWDGDHPHGMHESLTLDDLGSVARGLNVTTTPTNEWDRIV